ncbi:MAG: hypothetical protein IKF16_12040 [Lachnospiraceae bacterium]|nr:hypothetical protein [Lachnospiraceae bacterium]
MTPEEMEKRKQELVAIVGNDPMLRELIEDAVFLEAEIEAMRKLPAIKVDPNNPERQKQTAAAKLRKEDMQQYTNIMKILLHASGADEAEEESPLRMWMRKRAEG